MPYLRKSTLLAVLITLFGINACATKQYVSVDGAPVKFKILDLESQKLFGVGQFEDDPLEICRTEEMCYVTYRQSYIALKQKWIDLEEQLRACEKSK